MDIQKFMRAETIRKEVSVINSANDKLKHGFCDISIGDIKFRPSARLTKKIMDAMYEYSCEIENEFKEL